MKPIEFPDNGLAVDGQHASGPFNFEPKRWRTVLARNTAMLQYKLLGWVAYPAHSEFGGSDRKGLISARHGEMHICYSCGFPSANNYNQ